MQLITDISTTVAAALTESAPWLIIGFLIAGLLHEFVPQQRMKRHLGGGGWRPLLKATALGSTLPICSCSAVPIGLGLARSGAAVGTALSFMATAPTLSPIVLLMGYALLGPQLLATYVIVMVIGALTLGWLGNQLLLQQAASMSHTHSKSCGCGGAHSKGDVVERSRLWHRLLRAGRWGVWELGADTSGPLLVGLTIAAVLMTAIPTESVSQWLGEPSLLAIVAAVALALPAYTCSVPSLFIAQGLLLKGVSPGVAAAFIIAGPATNLGEILALRSGLGKRTAYFYAGAMLTLAVLGGVAANRFVSREAIDQTAVVASDSGIGFCSICQQTHDPFADIASSGGAQHLETESIGAAVSWWRWPFVAAAALMIAVGATRRWARLKSRWAPSSPDDCASPPRTLLQLGGNH